MGFSLPTALVPGVPPAEQKELCRLLIDRLQVRRVQPDSTPGRNVVHFRMKLHLPRLVEGMEERVVGTSRPKRSALSIPARSVNFEAQVDFTNAARGEVEILAPFRQVVRVARISRMPAPKPARINVERARHPIHDVLAWQTKLDKGEIQNRAALARKLGVTRAAVTQALKLTQLVPEIKEYLAGLKTAAEMRHFSLRRLGKWPPCRAPAKGAHSLDCARALVRGDQTREVLAFHQEWEYVMCFEINASTSMSHCFHQVIDARLLGLVKAAIRKIDANPALRRRMEKNLERWSDVRLREEWRELLRQPWPDLRQQLLADTEAGAALRQDAPLGGILTAAERARIMREFAHDASAA
jgi:hypothetical protein